MHIKVIVWLVMTVNQMTSAGNITRIKKPDLVQLVASVFVEDSGHRDNVQRIESYFCRDHCGYTVPSFLKPLTGIVGQAHGTLVDPFFGHIGRCLHCSCGSDCHNIGNCCHPQGVRPSTPQNITFECVSADMATRLGVATNEIGGRWYYMITRCSGYFQPDQDIVEKCENPDFKFAEQAVPVTSLNTSRNYLNKFCAVCNNENEVESWHAHFDLELHLWSFVRTLQSPEDFYSYFFMDIKQTTRTNIYFTPKENLHDDISYECYQLNKLHKTCSNDVTDISHWDQLFVHACESTGNRGDVKSALQIFQFKDIYYKNVFCWLCQNPYWPGIIRTDYVTDREVSFQTLLSGSVALKNVERVKGGYMGSNEGNANGCTCREVFSTIEGICRPVLCPVGEYYVACDCMPFMNIAPFYTKLPLTVRLLHQNSSFLGLNDANTDYVKKLAETIASVIQDLTGVEIKILEIFSLYYVESDRDHYNVLLSVFKILDTMQIRKSLSKIYDVVDEGIEIKVDDDQFNVVFEDKFEANLKQVDAVLHVAVVTMTEKFANNHSVTPLLQQRVIDEPLIKCVEISEPFRRASFCKLVCIYSNESAYNLYKTGGNEEASALVVECKSVDGLDYIRVCSDAFEATNEEIETESHAQVTRISLLILTNSVITVLHINKLT